MNGKLKSLFTGGCVVCALLTAVVAVGQERRAGASVTPSSTRVGNSDKAQSNSSQGGERASDGSQVEVNKDRFGGATTVKLKPQLLLDTPDHQLTMSVETKLKGKKRIGIFEMAESVEVMFMSHSKAGINFDDKELHFLVDGEQVRIGKTGTSFSNSSVQSKPELRVGLRLISVFPLDKLQNISKGRNVEMRLGKIELTLDAKLLSNLRAFVAASEGASKQ